MCKLCKLCLVGAKRFGAGLASAFEKPYHVDPVFELGTHE
jgi:hypothetical protein